jgi:beta-N-acetylhexosaminidase
VVTDDLTTVTARDLPPFSAAVTQGIDALMTAHVVVPALGSAPGVPATLDARVVARARSLGLTGPIITDALDMGAVAHDPGFGEACVRALLAGADLLCLGTTLHRDDEALYRSAHAAVTAAVRTGRLHRERLAEAATRTARLRRTARAARPDAAAAEARLTQLGAQAARRALRWAGEPARLATHAAPVVVDLRTRLNHAAGRVATHLSDAVLSAWPAAVAANTVPDDGPVLLVTRDAASDPTERDRLTAALSTRPDAVVLHAGTAASAPITPARHVLLTWGTGRANATAAVEALRA